MTGGKHNKDKPKGSEVDSGTGMGFDTFLGMVDEDARDEGNPTQAGSGSDSEKSPEEGQDAGIESLANAPTGVDSPQDSDDGHSLTVCREIAETGLESKARPSIMPPVKEINEVRFGNDRYTMLRRLGRGGMSEIYVIRDEAGNRKAVKFTKDDLADNPAMTEKLKCEGRIVQACNNCDNIVTVFDHGEATVTMKDGSKAKRYAVVMELLEGMIMRKFMYSFHFNREEEHSVAVPNTVQASIIREMAFGIGYMARRPVKYDMTESTFEGDEGYIHKHQKFKITPGFIHRDIKPENVALTNIGRPVIIDFDGALGLDDPANGGEGNILGTPFYMSPNAFQGEKLLNEDDVFSLCATAQEMACGMTLNSIISVGDVYDLPLRMYSQQATNYERKKLPNPIDKLVDNVDSEYAQLINEGLRYNQSERIKAEDLEKELTSWLHGRGIDDPRGHIAAYMNHIRGLPADKGQIEIIGNNLDKPFELKQEARIVFKAGYNPLWYNLEEADVTTPFELEKK